MTEVEGIKIGGGNPLVLIAGPCVVESSDIVFATAVKIKEITERLGMPYIFKSSFKKANRTSVASFTGPGDEKALKILASVKSTLGLPVLTDIHAPEDAKMVGDSADVLQIPAFLCRQTDLLLVAGRSGKAVNIKKGQFLAPEDMAHAAAKVASTGNNKILLTERGTTFGYHDLVVDMRSLVIMKKTGYPVVMDATHSVQQPSKGAESGGRPEFIKPLARAAVAVGIDALFLEVHPDPQNAKSDAASQFPLDQLEDFLIDIKRLDEAARGKG
ncbi:MAG: 3-deoxy-8-phosphooctulonate synthase [Ignavibacteriales bacterium]|nr:MAG: 3-deoxy-8-phosphooctulonate synthase [Ignavibacteriaceae bacterium]MBW7873658.1 3-deoxy-8-phosphooctulonate synthase [Ignavibacteria bacterium]MCZ2143888.1 3-deoxy-8-phosphooctulonate synthase [Ignavibacteriales bacterium]OQY72569.1 MAG: 3-deoxy-8-phosphooctulonate synthase [Ignavibacteriales bacterium UTCHB3]MBV6445841.1 2-dehydro-3-deoxyphosphooctonate aldolase [Ignavibacteriaceae bacterium]